MKILVDARQATRNLTGIRTCITSLVRELVGQNHETGKILILPDQALTPFRKTEHRSPADILWGLVKHEIWKQLYLPIKAARERADVLVSLDPIGPLFCTKPTVITIHDLTCFNEGVKWDRWSIYERILVPLCARRASKIITFAQATRRDINEYLGIGDDKIVVTAEGADEHFRVTTDTDGLDDVRLRYDLPESFILTVGSLANPARQPNHRQRLLRPWGLSLLLCRLDSRCRLISCPRRGHLLRCFNHLLCRPKGLTGRQDAQYHYPQAHTHAALDQHRPIHHTAP